MTTKIPTSIINQLISYINFDVDLQDIDEKKSQKLIKILIELWLFIYNRQIEDQDIQNLKGYTNIDKKLLDNFSIRLNNSRLKYNQLLDILIVNKLISVNEKYSVGNFYKSYRVETDFISCNFTDFEIDFNKIYSNTRNKSYWIEKYPELTNLIEDCYNTTIDLSSYLDWLIANEGIELKPVLDKGVLKRRFLNKERIYQHFNLALKVNLKNLWFKLSNEGRFYSSISNLPYNAVDFIKLYGNDTIEIDIKNSQPLLLGLLLNNDKYMKDVINGVFYDVMANELGIERNEFKPLCYKYILFSSKPLKSGKIYNAIKKVYGTIIDDINAIKENECLAKKLQKMESDIFVKNIGKLKISKLLRHDQVVVKNQDELIVKKFLVNEYNKLNINISL